MKDLKDALKPRYNQIIELAKADALQTEPPKPQEKPPTLIIKNNKLYRKKVIKNASDHPMQQSKLILIPAPHREPKTITWLTKEQAEEKRKAVELDKLNRWTIADPTAEQEICNALDYQKRHANTKAWTAETINGLSDSERAKAENRRAERKALSEKMDKWNYTPPQPKPQPQEEPKPRKARKDLEKAQEQQDAIARVYAMQKNWNK